jgi:hypothetical protein
VAFTVKVKNERQSVSRTAGSARPANHRRFGIQQAYREGWEDHLPALGLVLNAVG